jgi:micrococcal nuclease
VVDGDTIDVSIAGKVYRVRLIGIDAPEKGENFFSQATAKMRELAQGKNVILVRDISETDPSGRLLRYVLAGDKFVNYDLVFQGFARPVTLPPDFACQDTFLAAQLAARGNQAGLWKPTPTRRPSSTPRPTSTRRSSITPRPSNTLRPLFTHTPTDTPTPGGG